MNNLILPKSKQYFYNPYFRYSCSYLLDAWLIHRLGFYMSPLLTFRTWKIIWQRGCLLRFIDSTYLYQLNTSSTPHQLWHPRMPQGFFKCLLGKQSSLYTVFLCILCEKLKCRFKIIFSSILQYIQILLYIIAYLPTETLLEENFL